MARDRVASEHRLGLESRWIRTRKWSEMANADKRKQSLYFPEDMLKEIQHEAQRLDRSLSWIVQQGWKLARERLKAFPASKSRSPVMFGTAAFLAASKKVEKKESNAVHA